MDSKKMMGFDIPGDQKFPVRARDWNAMKLAMWRGRAGWEIAKRQAEEILQNCKHAEGCPGATVETEPCLRGCADREMRMSALVILNAARMFAPVNARRPADEPYYAPSRENFSDVLSELGAAQVEIVLLREALRMANIEPPSPSAVQELPQTKEPAQLPGETPT